MSTNPEKANEASSANNIPVHNVEIEQTSNQDETDQHQMILTIDVGSKIEQLKIYDITNPNKDIYEFCLLHKLSYFNMEEITKQTTEVIAEQGRALLHNHNDINKSTNKEEDKSEHIHHTVSDNDIEHQQEIINEINHACNKSPVIEALAANETEHKEHKPFAKKQPEGKNKSINVSKNSNKTHKHSNNNKLFVYQVCERPCSENKKKRYYNSVLNKKIYPSKGTARSKPSFRRHIQSESPNYQTSTQSKQINNGGDVISKSCSNNTKDDNQVQTEQHMLITLNELLQNEIIRTEPNRYILSKEKQNNITKSKGKGTTTANRPEQVQNDVTKKNHSNNTRNRTGEIYERNIKYKENTKKRVESLRDTLNQSDDELFTFHPKINKISARVLLKRQHNNNECYNPERIRNYKKYFEQKLAKHKQDIKHHNGGVSPDDFDNCTFKPEINARSQTIENRKQKSNNVFMNNAHPPKETDAITGSKAEQVTTQPNPNNNRFEKLYLDSYSQKQHLRQKQLEVNSEFTYFPFFVNDNSRIKTPFNERLEQYNCRSKEKISKIKQSINDEEQANNTFRPNLCSTKRFENRKKMSATTHNNHKNTRNNDVFNNLYIYNQIYSQRKDETNQQINQKEKQAANMKNVNESSNVLIENKKLSAFKKIFSLLDSDQDGFINSISMTKKNLPNKVKDILSPIFSWLQSEKESINEEDFISIMEQFYSYLPYDKRRAIILMDRNKPLHPTHSNYNSFSFRPSLVSKQTSNTKTHRSQPNNVGTIVTNKDVSALTHITRDNNANCHNIKTEHHVN